MKIDVKQIREGEDSVTVRYRQLTPFINRILAVLKDSGGKLWGKSGDQSLSFGYEDILYLESVDDKVFVYTDEQVLKIEGSLNSFMLEADNEIFFRCSKSMVINVNRVSSLRSLSSNRIDAVMEGGEHIIISRRYASEFRKLLRGERE
jgi:DNA-binding LytR/AlgR family response regulator